MTWLDWIGRCAIAGGLATAGCGDDAGGGEQADTTAAETSTETRGEGADSSSSGVDGSSEGDSTSSGEASTDETGEPPLPAACEDAGLPLPRGQETQAGHVATVAELDAAELESWLGEAPSPDGGVLVLASHPEYDCDRLLTTTDFNLSYGFSQQIVYVFPGPIEVGTYVVGTDVRAWAASWLGDGGGNGGGGEGELTEGSLTIVSVDEACVTGTKPFSAEYAYGFAVSTDPSCG